MYAANKILLIFHGMSNAVDENSMPKANGKGKQPGRSDRHNQYLIISVGAMEERLEYSKIPCLFFLELNEAFKINCEYLSRLMMMRRIITP